MRSSTRESGTDLMANHVETLTSEAHRAEPRRADAGGGPRAGVVWRFCRRKPLGALGGLIVLALLVMAALAPWIAHYTYDETLRGARLKAPSAQFWMGTDNLGRDMWSRVAYGARVSVTVGFGAVLLANALGALVGVTSGYFGGKYDICVQRVVDAWQSFPFLVVILSIMAVLGPGLLNIVLALGVIGAANASRVIRGTTISVAENVYIESARAIGCGHLRIMVRHILPNVAGTIIVLATIGLGAFILAESALSFLGFGVPPPYPSWGGMLSGAGRSFFYQAPWMAIYPGLAISLAVFGFNMLGDALRDVLDPRLRGVGGRVR
jgi:peptide/nickel transport system permease protein